jgi:hypothetical protein
MMDMHSKTSERFGWLGYPLLVFAASRGLLFAFAASAPLFGPRLGAPPGLPPAFALRHPFWATLVHGDVADCLRVALGGYQSPADASIFPVLPLLAKGLGKVALSVEAAVIALALLACAAAFVGCYRLFADLRGREAARWGVALLAAWPASYHLSDGSALGPVLALTAWGVWLALRGRTLPSALLLALAALAHPAGILAVLAVAALPTAPGTGWRKLALLVPAGALAAWTIYLRSHLGVSLAVLWGVLLPKTVPSTAASSAMLWAWGGLVGAFTLLLARVPGLRWLALAGGFHLCCILQGWSPAAAHALVLCWPAFLGAGVLLADRQALRAPLLAVLGAQQGLLLYCFTHFLRLV